ncbi:ribosomal protein, putative, partial [Ichthyophthirius multifiliis]
SKKIKIKKMQVQVLSLDGTTQVYSVQAEQSIQELKYQISKQFGLDEGMLTLVQNGCAQGNNEKVADDSTYYLSLKLLGGKKKKKKNPILVRKNLSINISQQNVGLQIIIMQMDQEKLH